MKIARIRIGENEVHYATPVDPQGTLMEILSGDPFQGVHLTDERVTSLPVGTVILTGTPAGVGVGRTPQRWLKEGDSVEIEKIGILSNLVTRA